LLTYVSRKAWSSNIVFGYESSDNTMSLSYAILGLLSWRPLSGYDLKKIFFDSAILYWSGNNNQIYKSLVQLHAEDLVTQEIQYQEYLPARKIYTITEKGRTALKAWVLSTPELPEFHNAFLIQLTWADLLTDAELDGIIKKYEEEVQLQLLMQQEKARRTEPSSARTSREAYLWEMTSKNLISVYENELAWVRQLQAGLLHRS
jgi:PadR family transcriptional regulator AphA